MISCRHCSHSNAEGSRFCSGCGSELDELCAACGQVSRAPARFCAHCGSAFASRGTSAADNKSPLVEGERKHVTVLFADIRGSTQLIQALDPEAAMLKLDVILAVMKQAVGRFGGIVNYIRGDGIMALFGAPIACEDHAVRACLAATLMLEGAAAADAAGVQLRVGMDSGQVVVRSTGQDASDYDVSGVVAHIASRVEQQAAPGSACMTGRTARLARGYADVSPLGPVALKGVDQPVELFRLLSAVARPSWEVRCSVYALNRFVGRHNELAQMSAALGRAAMGSGQVVTLVADAGYGKSRLVHEFLRTVPAGAWHVIRVAALNHAAQSPYYLAAELLRSWLAVDAADSAAELSRKLARSLVLLDPQGNSDLPAIKSLLDLPTDDDWLRLLPATRRERLGAAIRSTLLREAALRPLILLVEDYHWADAPSAGLLDALVQGMGASRLLLLVTTRPDRCPPWTSRSYCLQLPLPPLGTESAGALLRELLAPSPGLGRLTGSILAQAAGVPLFIEEIARSLIEGQGHGATQPLPAGASARAPEYEVPESVQAVIAARIDRLAPSRRRLLQIASVIGKDVPLSLLSAVADLPREELLTGMADLQAAEFVYELSAPSGVEFTFRHVLIQSVAYEEMLRKQRRELHARVLSAMEALFAERLDEMAERLADHAWRGEAWPAAVAHGLKAGDRAVARGAWRDAVGFYGDAIEALKKLPATPQNVRTSIEARLRLRVALPGVADLPRIAQCLAEANELVHSIGDAARTVEIGTSQCLVLTKMGRLAPAIEAGERSHQAAVGSGDRPAALGASFALAQACWYAGQFERAERLIGERLGDIHGELRLRHAGTTGTASLLSLVCLAKTYAITGRADEAFEAIAHARRIADDTGKPFDLSYCGVGRGYCLLLNGQPQAAADELQVSLQLALAGDIALLIPSSQRYLGRAYAMTGQLDDADRVLRDGIQRTESAGLLGMRLWCSAALGQTWALQDRLTEAHAMLTCTLEEARTHGFRPLRGQLLASVGDVCSAAADGRFGAAEPWYLEGIALCGELGMSPEQARARDGLAAWRRGRLQPSA